MNYYWMSRPVPQVLTIDAVSFFWQLLLWTWFKLIYLSSFNKIYSRDRTRLLTWTSQEPGEWSGMDSAVSSHLMIYIFTIWYCSLERCFFFLLIIFFFLFLKLEGGIYSSQNGAEDVVLTVKTSSLTPDPVHHPMTGTLELVMLVHVWGISDVSEHVCSTWQGRDTEEMKRSCDLEWEHEPTSSNCQHPGWFQPNSSRLVDPGKKSTWPSSVMVPYWGTMDQWNLVSSSLPMREI